ncbi:MAG: YfhO family protein [Anaerolineales bacterium]
MKLLSPITRHLPLNCYLLITLLLLWPLALHPNFVPFAPRARFSDLLISHLPNALYLRDSLARYGQWPLWQTQVFAGQPFAADPLAGLWYPPNWLLAVLPLPFGFNLLFALHLAWAGYGMFRFLLGEGLNPGPAFLGGLAFAGTPKLVAHLAAGHVSLVFAVAWTPWVLLAIRRAATEGGLRQGARAGAMLALTFVADVRWAFFAGALGAAFWISHLPPFAQRREKGQGIRGALATLGFALSFLALIAILALPLAEFILQSNRRALTAMEAGAYSLPPAYLLGLLVPDPYGFHEWMTHVGIAPLLLALLGMRRRSLFWIGITLLGVAFSLGTNFLLFPLLLRLLPGLGFLRVPPRAWFLVAFSLCLLAAHGAQRLSDSIPSRLNYTLTHPHTSTRLIAPTLILFTVANLIWVDSALLEARPLPEPSPATRWLESQPGLFRVYSPSYSLPQPDALQHTDGVDPLYLSTYAEFMARASGLPLQGYSVTVPSFVEENAEALAASPDARLLGLLNVKYVAAEFPINVPGLTLVQTFGDMRIYENGLARPRAWVEPGMSQAAILERSPNRMVVQATGPGQLVLSEIAYPGWQAHLDGQAVPIETAHALLRAVRLEEGAHTVVFEFHPRTLYLGAAITALGLIALAGIWRWAR